uniref:Uncharacterized protein n=1 Tax=uncultured Armatimonadetes bacterium TaxID=157466 RepID=A0A6J4JF90_9BACT|nr:hypothetical protein AVDCRST_MAG63-3428 [uncultured Armatimonadetes bacterium]
MRHETAHLMEKRSALLASLDDPRPAVISVTNTAHAGTRVSIDEVALEVAATTGYANFTRDSATGTIRTSPLT